MGSNSKKSKFVVRLEGGVINMQKSNFHSSFKLLKIRDSKSQYSKLFLKKQKIVGGTNFFNSDGFLLEVGERFSGVICVDRVLSQKKSVEQPNMFVVKKGVRLVILERIINSEETIPSTLSLRDFWVLEEGANMSHYLIGQDEIQDKVIQNKIIYQKKNSELSMFSLFCNNINIVNNIGVELSGKNAFCRLSSVSLLRQKSEVKHNITVYHASQECTSEQLYKGVYSDSSKGGFDSVVVVEKDSQKTVAKQKNSSILLSELANVQSNPQLEIFADEVECAHGSTIGQISEEELFYLRSRGIGLDVARKLLTLAFLNEVIAKISHKEIANEVDGALNKQLERLYLN